MADRKSERMEERRVTEQHFCHCMIVLQVETSIEAYLLSELTNQKSITTSLPDADEDFIKKRKHSCQKKIRNPSSELVSK